MEGLEELEWDEMYCTATEGKSIEEEGSQLDVDRMKGDVNDGLGLVGSKISGFGIQERVSDGGSGSMWGGGRDV
jgi:hypothetical protein